MEAIQETRQSMSNEPRPEVHSFPLSWIEEYREHGTINGKTEAEIWIEGARRVAENMVKARNEAFLKEFGGDSETR